MGVLGVLGLLVVVVVVVVFVVFVAVVAAAVVAVAAAALPKGYRTYNIVGVYIHVHATRACIGQINLQLPVLIPTSLFKYVFVVDGGVPINDLSYGSLFRVLLGAHIRYAKHVGNNPGFQSPASLFFLLS